jgi:hypothetical protein
MNTVQRVFIIISRDLVYNIFVASQAIFPNNAGVFGMNSDRLVKILESEGPGMMVPVLHFHKPAADFVRGKMAVIAGCRGMVTRLGPSIVMISHDMAIDAGARIVAEIGSSFPVVKSVPPRSQKDSRRRA